MIHYVLLSFVWFVPLETFLGMFLFPGPPKMPRSLTLGHLWSFNTSQTAGTSGSPLPEPDPLLSNPTAATTRRQASQLGQQCY